MFELFHGWISLLLAPVLVEVREFELELVCYSRAIEIFVGEPNFIRLRVLIRHSGKRNWQCNKCEITV